MTETSNTVSIVIDNKIVCRKGKIITNCPVTAAGVDIAVKIYGLAVSTLKGKTT